MKPHLSKKDISKSAIEIERHILNESGGIQDQIWSAYGGFNVLDIVALANCILANNCEDIPNACAANINGDDYYNVLDIVSLANYILSGEGKR